MARRSPHIVSHDLHEVEGHTEKDVLPKKGMSKFCRIGDAFNLKSSESYFLLSIVSCIFDIDITSRKRNEHQSPFLFRLRRFP